MNFLISYDSTVYAEISKRFLSDSSIQKILESITHAREHSNLFEECYGTNILFIPKLKFKELLVFLVFLEEYDQETSWAVKFEITEKFYKKYEDWQQVILLSCCNPNSSVKHFLACSNILHPREIFGSILNRNLYRRLTLLNYGKERKRKKLPEQRRIGVGYRDKGSVSKFKIERYDISFNEMQKNIELRRKIRQDTAEFIRGWCEP